MGVTFDDVIPFSARRRDEEDRPEYFTVPRVFHLGAVSALYPGGPVRFTPGVVGVPVPSIVHLASQGEAPEVTSWHHRGSDCAGNLNGDLHRGVDVGDVLRWSEESYRHRTTLGTSAAPIPAT